MNRNRSRFVNLAILCAIPAILLSSLSCTQSTEQPNTVTDKSRTMQRESFKIVNWNILYGFSGGETKEAGENWLADQTPDVVALQELNGINERQLAQHAESWSHKYVATNKESGFPVGLTSNSPIHVIERASEGFHHGYLHCKTNGIHFIVVHFWPGKEHELDTILERVTPLLEASERVVILGDFNACSRRDEAFLSKVENREIDYALTNKLESFGFVDLTEKHDPDAKVSCPSPITIPEWSDDMDELRSKQYRVDFIFADSTLAKCSSSGTIIFDAVIDPISDHYPVIAELNLATPDDLPRNLKLTDD